jgi:hypothetical protein
MAAEIEAIGAQRPDLRNNSAAILQIASARTVQWLQTLGVNPMQPVGQVVPQQGQQVVQQGQVYNPSQQGQVQAYAPRVGVAPPPSGGVPMNPNNAMTGLQSELQAMMRV